MLQVEIFELQHHVWPAVCHSHHKLQTGRLFFPVFLVYGAGNEDVASPRQGNRSTHSILAEHILAIEV